MVFTKSALTIVIFASLSLMSCASWRAEAPPGGGPRADEQVEPSAGGWKTWVLTSGDNDALLRQAQPHEPRLARQ